jgi:hypothetical protein
MEVEIHMMNGGFLMKKINKILCTILVLSMLVALLPTTAKAATKKEPSLSKTKVTLCVGQSTKLKVKNSGSSKVTWTSSNKKIATVKSGKVKGIKAGKVTITAKVGKKSVKCKVTVRKHSWYTVEETGHFATVVTNQKYIACGCGEVFSTNAEFRVHDAATNYEHSYSTGTRKVEETQWVETQAAYDEEVTTGYICSICGATK